MAQLPKHRKYLTLEDVRVSYDPKSDSILLTSGDRELKSRGGFKLDLNSTSSAGRMIRDLLRDRGLIRGEPWSEIDRDELLDRVFSSTDPSRVLIGTGVLGESVYWDASVSNLFAYGQPGSGVSALANAVFCHSLAHNWAFYGLDFKDDLGAFEIYPATANTISRDLTDAMNALDSIIALMRERSKAVARLGVGEYANLPDIERGRNTVVFVNDLLDIAIAMRHPERGEKPIASELMRRLHEIDLFGRQVGVHLVISDRSGVDFLELEQLKSSAFELTVGYSPRSQDVEKKRYEHLKRGLPMGRGVYAKLGQKAEVQLLPIEPADRDRWLHNQNR